jgi:WASH complex subunit strumpellin
MIFVLVPFCPAILESHDSKMREICDKHFSDNWVIPIYNGVNVDLLSYWSSFTSATKAMTNNITEKSVASFAKYFHSMVKTSIDRIKTYLVEGQL